MKKSLMILMVCSFFYASAQEEHINYKLPNSNEDLSFVWGEKNKDTAVVKVLLENAPRYFNAPGMPRFAMIGKDRKFYLGIGGYVKASLSYDWGNPINNTCMFETSNIPMNNPPGNKALIQFGAQTSTLNVNFVGLPGTKNQIGCYFNLNFTNPNYGLFVLNAYAKYRGFTAGYNFSLFTDVMAGPPTIDFQGPNSLTLVPNAVLDYEKQFGKHWSIGIGLEMPISNYTVSDSAISVNQVAPDIPAYVQFSWNKRNSWIRLSGILRNMQYRDLVVEKNQNSIGWGAKLSGSAAITKWVTTYYQIVCGKGIANYIQDLNGKAMDMTPSEEHIGRLSNVGAWGGYFGIQINLPKNVLLSCTYSGVDIFENNYEAPGQYKSAQYIVANLFWNIAPNVQMGIEYLYGDRKNQNLVQRNNNRTQAMIQVNF